MWVGCFLSSVRGTSPSNTQYDACHEHGMRVAVKEIQLHAIKVLAYLPGWIVPTSQEAYPTVVFLPAQTAHGSPPTSYLNNKNNIISRPSSKWEYRKTIYCKIGLGRGDSPELVAVCLYIFKVLREVN